MTRTRQQQQGLTHQACILISGLVTLSALIIVDAWVFLSVLLYNLEVG